MTVKPCPLCERVANAAKDPMLVAELETGVAVLFEHQFFRGYTLFISKRHASELFELDAGWRARFLKEMTRVARAVHAAFKPRKMNYELLGNVVPHLHWHLIPRYADDPKPGAPIWEIEAGVREVKPSAAEAARLRDQILGHLCEA